MTKNQQNTQDASDERSRRIVQSSLLSLFGNALLAAGKIITGFLAGSAAVLADGIDSSTDVVISLISVFAARVMSKPSDREHPYGHGRAETIATTVLAFAIFFAGAQLVLTTIHSLLENASRPLPLGFAIWVTLVSIIGKLLLAWNQFSVGRKTGSRMLIANGKNMRNDVLMSCTVLVGLVFTFILHLAILDSIIALVLGLWIIRSAVGIFLEANTELMDGNKDQSLYQAIFDAVRQVPQAGNPHRVRVRRMAALITVDLDIEVDGTKSVTEGHDIAIRIEQAIKTQIESVYDVMVHIEPLGVHEADEQFGLREDLLSKPSV